MSEQKWEYCELNIWGSTEVKGKGYLYDVWIDYMSRGNTVRYLIAEKNGKNAKPFSYNPFRRAISILGEVGWEMVSYQIASGGSMEVRFNSDLKIAVFKRQIQKDRIVDDVKLTELIFP